ncbi:hypothetical protein [Streptomyces sp. NBC_01334]|uniref:hypothetical protein n=1 Tax=Streptomyces sp. NBC_01334 TaxID=2903827 RepID=UPI003FA3A582
MAQADADDDLNWAVSVDSTERCINRLKQWRAIATRYEKTATIYLAGLHIAGIFLWSAR